MRRLVSYQVQDLGKELHMRDLVLLSMRKKQQRTMRRLSLCRHLTCTLAASIAAVTYAKGFEPDREHFFAACSQLTVYDPGDAGPIKRGSIRLGTHERDRLSVLFDAWEKIEGTDKRRLAFVLATARRETAGTFASIREAPRCKDDESCRERAIGKLLAKRAVKSGKPVKANYAMPDDQGQRYYGRGYIQLTSKKNYERAERELGIPLVAQPDKALEPLIASQILVRAMLAGWFGSGRPLSFYINAKGADYVSARNNVNPDSPLAHKRVVAAFALEFDRCLRQVARAK